KTAYEIQGDWSSDMCSSDLPIRTVRPDLALPEPVERLVLRALEKDPRARFASAAEMREEIEQLLAGTRYSGKTVSQAALAAPPRSEERRVGKGGRERGGGEG